MEMMVGVTGDTWTSLFVNEKLKLTGGGNRARAQVVTQCCNIAHDRGLSHKEYLGFLSV